MVSDPVEQVDAFFRSNILSRVVPHELEPGLDGENSL